MLPLEWPFKGLNGSVRSLLENVLEVTLKMRTVGTGVTNKAEEKKEKKNELVAAPRVINGERERREGGGRDKEVEVGGGDG